MVDFYRAFEKLSIARIVVIVMTQFARLEPLNFLLLLVLQGLLAFHLDCMAHGV